MTGLVSEEKASQQAIDLTEPSQLLAQFGSYHIDALYSSHPIGYDGDI